MSAWAQESATIEVKLFVGETVPELDMDSCYLDDFGSPARLHVESNDEDHKYKFDLPEGKIASASDADGAKEDGCYYVFEIDLGSAMVYRFEILETEIASVNYVAMRTKGEVNLFFTGTTDEPDESESITKAKKPVEPIAYAPGAIGASQRSLVNKAAKTGDPLLLVITSYEYQNESTAGQFFKGMCDDVASWYTEVAGEAHWQDVAIDSDSICAVTGSSPTSATVLIRRGDHILSFTSGGLDMDAISWIEGFVAAYPYDPANAIEAVSNIPGSWEAQPKSTGDVTDIATTPRESRP